MLLCWQYLYCTLLTHWNDQKDTNVISTPPKVTARVICINIGRLSTRVSEKGALSNCELQNQHNNSFIWRLFFPVQDLCIRSEMTIAFPPACCMLLLNFTDGNINLQTRILIRSPLMWTRVFRFVPGFDRSLGIVPAEWLKTNSKPKTDGTLTNSCLITVPAKYLATIGRHSGDGQFHYDVIKWKHFPRYWPFVRGIHRSPVVPLTKASDAMFWCFLWSAPEQTV